MMTPQMARGGGINDLLTAFKDKRFRMIKLNHGGVSIARNYAPILIFGT